VTIQILNLEAIIKFAKPTIPRRYSQQFVGRDDGTTSASMYFGSSGPWSRWREASSYPGSTRSTGALSNWHILVGIVAWRDSTGDGLTARFMDV
jgi:hypothetical protein